MNGEFNRVSLRIGGSILAFMSDHKRFHADELRAHVNHACGSTAPGSADRVLRALRQQGKANYRVVSRSRSLYEVLPVAA